MTTRTLNRLQARWSIFLADFDFEILYHLGTLQRKVNTISGRAEYVPKGGDRVVAQQTTTLLKPNQVQLQLNSTNFVYQMPVDSSLMTRIHDTTLILDPFFLKIQTQLNNPKPSDQEEDRIKSFSFNTSIGLLLYDNLVYVLETQFYS